MGSEPFKVLFETVAGPVARPHTPGAFWRGLRTVAVDGTSLHLPDSEQIATLHTKRKRKGEDLEFGYPLLRLLVLIECGTRAILSAAFGPETTGETGYAQRLVDQLTRGMLVLLDTGFDGYPLLCRLRSTGAEFLCRSGARRIPLIIRRLPDGSYLSTFGMGKLPVRIIEAWITVTYSDGTVRREQWRLATSLTDHTRYPARELVDLYHERWQIETAFFSIKATMLDGRVLRSHRPEDIDQEVYALLTVYQALVRISDDATTGHPHPDPDRISFTVALDTARDQVTTANGVLTTGAAVLTGAIGRAVLDNLLPARRRQRIKARTRKNPTSKYSKNSLQHPTTVQHYTLNAEVMVMEQGLTTRPKR
ncbi:IS4 family transposase [Actinacidiphila soli]